MRAYELLEGEKPVKREVNPFQSEKRLEQLLYRIPSLLLDEQVLIIGRQIGVETGTLDLLGIDKYGNVVVFELKKGDSGSGSASEGSILSQPQQYAQALQWFTYDDLNDVYKEYQTECDTANWPDAPTPTDETLLDAFSTHFGTTLEPESFNHHQRMVIVAEQITDRTAANARYLRDEGLHLQCVEVQRFQLAEGEKPSPTVVASTVVDYDDKRVQPREEDVITYPEINEAIVSRAYPAFAEVTHASAPDELFPGGFDHREPRMRSLHPDHPDAVRYGLRVKPLEKGHVRLAIDVTSRGLEIDKVDKESLAGQLRSATNRFERAGFEVDQDRNTFRIVTAHWDVDSVTDVRDNAFLDELADRYAELVSIGHEIMLNAE
ncbi:endonuclease NucS [Natrarchaeobius chitinivorans]|uniref:DUF91 domain-containing protein n=1 Tax=Natrarchaeobius chitinivorans TaxID=1679083 RepID=A0A3N6ME66_NATCH|nr:endonuclease NucS [Natrarchaeobius chitinivorans]RQG93881.1 DUF91 domain-containing protein [Natrarchaeobius chitinivorans]